MLICGTLWPYSRRPFSLILMTRLVAVCIQEYEQMNPMSRFLYICVYVSASPCVCLQRKRDVYNTQNRVLLRKFFALKITFFAKFIIQYTKVYITIVRNEKKKHFVFFLCILNRSLITFIDANRYTN